jgi:hypothetical protein
VRWSRTLIISSSASGFFLGLAHLAVAGDQSAPAGFGFEGEGA